ncbi:MAG TPA: MBL fold metallo-hydrolase [Candidatus Aminicenantes bacterium]|nr:MBL fold metallo-hydrolase [Candidatus Aminicenantes bacterium]
MAAVKITIIVDDTAGDGLLGEHGLAMAVETEGRCILFDTGQGEALAPNAALLGVELDRTDILVISHGHYDHTDGIPEVLRSGRKVDVYAHPDIVRRRYSIRGGRPRLVSMAPGSAAALDRLPPSSLHWVREPVQISGTIGLTGPIPRQTDFEDTGGPFYLDPEGREPDPLLDDIALWIATDEGIVVCVGCCHAGLVNTLRHVRGLNDGRRVRAVIGGFHLLEAGPARLERTAAEMRSLDPDEVIPCHCTGERGIAALEAALGKRVKPGRAGESRLF